MVANSFYNVMRMHSLHPLDRSRIWKNAPREVRLTTFDRLRPLLYGEAQSAGMNPQQLSPPPPGWEPPENEQDRRTPTAPTDRGDVEVTPDIGGSRIETK